MNRLSLLACLFLSGCSTRDDREIRTHKQVLDGAGQHRLLLKEVETHRTSHGVSYGFHSLVLESKDGDKWSEKIVITRADFEKGAEQSRWITDLHSFDSTKGHAVIKVYEEKARRADGSVEYQVSWREWDLVNNQQLQFWWDRSSGVNTFEKTVADKEPPVKKP